MLADELTGYRVIEQLREIHVQGRQFQQDKNERRDGGNAQAHPEIERARGRADNG